MQRPSKLPLTEEVKTEKPAFYLVSQAKRLYTTLILKVDDVSNKLLRKVETFS